MKRTENGSNIPACRIDKLKQSTLPSSTRKIDDKRQQKAKAKSSGLSKGGSMSDLVREHKKRLVKLFGNQSVNFETKVSNAKEVFFGKEVQDIIAD